MSNRKLGSIALARSLCYQINGAADDTDDIDGGGYGSVDIAEILSAEVVRLQKALAQPEFIKHKVENADDWSEWVCPDPKNYLMKCCDCGLVHEAQFGVVRYKSETEDCDIVDDPNLQAVFRMRRSEEWTPEDTAHRAGGLPMAQPEQEPTPWRDMVVVSLVREGINKHRARELADHFAAPPQQQAKPVAWGVFDGNLHDMFFTQEEAQEMVRLKGDGSTVAPLYTTPPAAQPKQKPMHPELRKMWEDYFDKCFRESSEPVPENFMDALKFDVAVRDAREWEKVDMREHAEGNLGIGTAPPPQQQAEPTCPECKAKVLFECVACSNNNYPPQRPWVGLTEEEIWSVVSRIGTADSDVNPYITIKDARAIEKLLKERNG